MNQYIICWGRTKVEIVEIGDRDRGQGGRRARKKRPGRRQRERQEEERREEEEEEEVEEEEHDQEDLTKRKGLFRSRSSGRPSPPALTMAMLLATVTVRHLNKPGFSFIAQSVFLCLGDFHV